jgi:hypothetical protein
MTYYPLRDKTARNAEGTSSPYPALLNGGDTSERLDNSKSPNSPISYDSPQLKPLAGYHGYLNNSTLNLGTLKFGVSSSTQTLRSPPQAATHVTTNINHHREGEWLLLMRRKRRELEGEIGRHQARLDNIARKAGDRKKLILARREKAMKKQ